MKELQNDDCIQLTLSNEGIAHLQLVRAAKLNSINNDMLNALLRAGELLRSSEGVRCVVLSGQGKAFSAGIDMEYLKGNVEPKEVTIVDRTHNDCNEYQQLVMQFRRMPVPVIAAIHGVCYGAGLAIASGADIRVATPDARLSLKELKWGIIPDMASFIVWKGIVREDQLATLVYTAKDVNGIEAQSLGLVTEVAEDALAKAMALAKDISEKNPDAIQEAKRLFEISRNADVDEILLEESRAQHRLAGSPNQIEAVVSQMQKRKPVYR
jgi:enoyl-CoA hydratase/carnithine racemase